MSFRLGILSAILLPLVFSSCGKQEDGIGSLSISGAGPASIEKFFSGDQQQALLSGGSPILTGSKNLDNINPEIIKLMSGLQGDAPTAVTAVSELRAFMKKPASSATPAAADLKLLNAVRDVAKWTQISDTDGNQLYKEVVVVKAPASVPTTAGDIKTENRLVKVTMKMFGASSYVVHHQVERNGGVISANTVNDEAVTAVGVTAVKARGSRGLVLYFPVKGGWLVYSLNAIKLEGLAGGAETPESLGKKNLGAYNFVAKAMR